jgi:subtilase family serine protease
LTLSATIANSGNMITETGSVTVRFYDGDPSSGGVQIGADQTVSLRGCGDNETVSVTWSDLAPGVYRLFVVVDPEDDIVDADPSNNTASRLVIVATDRIYTPLIQFTG